MLAEKWLHRTCMRESDELIQPKQSKNGNCERCGKEGALFLVIVREEKKVIDARTAILMAKAADEGEREEAESNVGTGETGEEEKQETTIRAEDFQSHTRANMEFEVVAETLTTDENATLSELEQLQARIRELQKDAEAT